MIDRRLPAGNAAERNKKENTMKKILSISSFILVILLGSFQNSNALTSAPSIIGISFSSKAYWDEGLQRCVDREKGCCLHIALIHITPGPGQINGTLETRQNNEVAFSFSKRGGILPETWNELSKTGYFMLDGDGTFSQEILRKLGLSSNFKLSEGRYPYTENGDVVTVIFK